MSYAWRGHTRGRRRSGRPLRVLMLRRTRSALGLVLLCIGVPRTVGVQVRCAEMCQIHMDYSVARRHAHVGTEPPSYPDCDCIILIAIYRALAVPSGVAGPPPPKTNPMTAPPEEANHAASAPTTSANSTQASAKTAAPPASATTATPTGSTGSKATTTADGVVAGLTHEAWACMAAVIGRLAERVCRVSSWV